MWIVGGALPGPEPTGYPTASREDTITRYLTPPFDKRQMALTVNYDFDSDVYVPSRASTEPAPIVITLPRFWRTVKESFGFPGGTTWCPMASSYHCAGTM